MFTRLLSPQQPQNAHLSIMVGREDLQRGTHVNKIRGKWTSDAESVMTTATQSSSSTAPVSPETEEKKIVSLSNRCNNEVFGYGREEKQSQINNMILVNMLESSSVLTASSSQKVNKSQQTHTLATGVSLLEEIQMIDEELKAKEEVRGCRSDSEHGIGMETSFKSLERTSTKRSAAQRRRRKKKKRKTPKNGQYLNRSHSLELHTGNSSSGMMGRSVRSFSSFSSSDSLIETALDSEDELEGDLKAYFRQRRVLRSLSQKHLDDGSLAWGTSTVCCSDASSNVRKYPSIRKDWIDAIPEATDEESEDEEEKENSKKNRTIFHRLFSFPRARRASLTNATKAENLQSESREGDRTPLLGTSAGEGGDNLFLETISIQPDVVFMDFPRHDGTPYFRYADDAKRPDFGPVPGPGRSVSFGAVRRREYKISFGDNPSCADTMPICLDWSHTAESTWSVDDFEQVRSMFPQEAPSVKACGCDIDGPTMVWRLSRQERYDLLIKVGEYTRSVVINLENDLFDVQSKEQAVATNRTGTLRNIFGKKQKQKQQKITQQ